MTNAEAADVLMGQPEIPLAKTLALVKPLQREWELERQHRSGRTFPAAMPPPPQLCMFVDVLLIHAPVLITAAQLLQDLRDEYPNLTKAECDECEDCGPMVMCGLHSFTSALHGNTWTSGRIKRDAQLRLSEQRR